jgi:hypothetical protein
VVCSGNCALQSKSWGAQCADAYKKENSGPCNDPLIANPEFAEQENAWLANFKAGAVHMRQTTLLWVLRIALYKRAKDKQGGAAVRRDHASREQQSDRLPAQRHKRRVLHAAPRTHLLATWWGK